MAEALKDLDELATEWLFDLAAAGRTKGTRDNYRFELRDWSRWVLDHPDPPATVADVRKEHVTHYLAEAAARGEKPNTVASRHRRLRAFFNWCEGQEIIVRSPMARLHEPTVPEDPPPVFTAAQLKALFTTTKADRSFKGIRDYTMLVVFADTGVRAEELVTMKLGNINYDAHTIEVTGKGGRRRNVAFGPKCGKALLAYQRARKQRSAAEGIDALWIGVRGPIASPQTVWRIVRDRAIAAGIDGRAFPHLFRHTFAHLFRLNGGQDSDLQSLGGWRSPKMLQRYGASAASVRAVAAHQRVDHLKDIL
jgi:site-specific recombinase XerD